MQSKACYFLFSTSLVPCLPSGNVGLWGSCQFYGSPDGSRTKGNASWWVWRFCLGPSHCLHCRAERRWPELPAPSGREGKGLKVGLKPCFIEHATQMHIQRVAFRTHPVRKDVQTISQGLGMLLQLLDFVRHAALSQLRQGHGGGGQEQQRVGPGMEQRASQRQQVRLLRNQSDAEQNGLMNMPQILLISSRF